MLDIEWLDIAMGVVVAWFLLAVVVSAINELGNRLLAVRSKQLWLALNQLLDGGGERALDTSWSRLRGIGRTAFSLWSFKGRPSDPARRQTITEQLYGTAAIQSLENQVDSDKKTRIHNIPTRVFTQALIELGVRDKSLDEHSISQYIDSLPDVPLKPQLQSLWLASGKQIVGFRQGVDQWFDNQMARVSAMYRAQVRWVAAAIAVLIVGIGWTAGFRVDSLTLVSDLQRDQNLRQAYVALASDLSADDQATLEAQGCGAEDDPAQDEVICLARGLGKADGLDISLTKRIGPGERAWDAVDDVWDGLRIALGLAITIAALSFGASFWWDVLRRLTGLRQAGKSAPSA